MPDERPYELHLFVCENETACVLDGPAREIRSRLKKRIKDAGLSDRVRANKAGCFSQCGHGPMMVVYPDGVWYAHLGLEDVDRIFEEHVVRGRPVEALRYRPAGPGANKLPRRQASSGSVADPEAAPANACDRCQPPRAPGPR